MTLKENKQILIRLYHEYVNKHLGKIFLALLLSIIVAGTTSSIAWLLDPAVKKIFIEAGMLRRVVTQIWNKKETFRVGIIFEYKDQTAYKNCQSLLEKHYLPYLKDYNTKVIGSRGIVVHEFVSDDFT